MTEDPIVKVDPVPYEVTKNHRRPFGKRWAIEYWSLQGEHDFRYFWFRRCAVRWAARVVG